MKGKGYDHGSNMKEKHQAVQRQFFEINPKALYMSCACPSLNLSVRDKAYSFVKVVTFFWIVQCICSLFLSSPKRWKILHDNVLGLILGGRVELKISKLLDFRPPK